MSFRFVDIDHLPSEYADFTVRTARPTLVYMFFLFFGLSFAASICVILTGNPMLLIPGVFFFLMLASYYAGLQVHRARESQRATELLNAIFASALSRGWRFCLIAGRDGRIVYTNPGFNALFATGKAGCGLADWLAAQKAPPGEEKALLSAIDGDHSVEAALNLDGCDGRLRLIVSVEPIERPKGFILLRGRDNPQTV